MVSLQVRLLETDQKRVSNKLCVADLKMLNLPMLVWFSARVVTLLSSKGVKSDS